MLVMLARTLVTTLKQIYAHEDASDDGQAGVIV